MSDQNNTSFAHAFLPGLILGLIVGAVAGAFVPDMMSGNKIKIDPNHTGSSIVDHDRDGRADDADEPTAQDLIDQAEAEAAEMADDVQDAAEDLIDDAENAIDNTVEDLKNNLPEQP